MGSSVGYSVGWRCFAPERVDLGSHVALGTPAAMCSVTSQVQICVDREATSKISELIVFHGLALL